MALLPVHLRDEVIDLLVFLAQLQLHLLVVLLALC